MNRLNQQRKDVAYLRFCQLRESLEGVADRYERLLALVEEFIDWIDEGSSDLADAVLKDAKGE